VIASMKRGSSLTPASATFILTDFVDIEQEPQKNARYAGHEKNASQAHLRWWKHSRNVTVAVGFDHCCGFVTAPFARYVDRFLR